MTKKFKAVLERLEPKGLGWVIARVPKWEVSGRARIRGEINGFAFRTSLFTATEGWKFILVNKQMQKGAGARLGDEVEIRVELDEEEREVVVPPELARVFREEKAVREFYEELSESARREVGKWITGVKSAEGRRKKAEELAERVLSVLEAEQELPPLIKRAFAENAKAAAGWKKMTARQRRGELLAVFGYKSPEARERRLGKIVEMAEKRGEKG